MPLKPSLHNISRPASSSQLFSSCANACSVLSVSSYCALFCSPVLSLARRPGCSRHENLAARHTPFGIAAAHASSILSGRSCCSSYGQLQKVHNTALAAGNHRHWLAGNSRKCAAGQPCVCHEEPVHSSCSIATQLQRQANWSTSSPCPKYDGLEYSQRAGNDAAQRKHNEVHPWKAHIKLQAAQT